MLSDKPFKFSELIKRTIFKGRPSYFNALDLNKELQILHSYIEEFNNLLLVQSDLDFTVLNFTETKDSSVSYRRLISIRWDGGDVTYSGVKFTISTGSISNKSMPFTLSDPTDNKPAIYIALVSPLKLVTFSENSSLCGINSNLPPYSASSVDILQYQNPTISLLTSEELASSTTLIAVLGVIHPKYKDNGLEDGYGYINYTRRKAPVTLTNGEREIVLKSNGTLHEYIMQKTLIKLSRVINEEQLSRRFHLADAPNFSNLRKNIGFDNLVNHRQLVQAENLHDLTDVPLARKNLGLGSASLMDVGSGIGTVAPGNIVPLGAIIMWSGSIEEIPKGWALCDGSNNTPNLSGKFIASYSKEDARYNYVGKQGGSDSITLSKEHMPPHRHIYTDDTNAKAHFGDIEDGFPNQVPSTNTMKTSGEKTGSGNVYYTTYEGGVGKGATSIAQPHDNIPPYFTLAYIMYKGVEIPTTTPEDNTDQNVSLVYPNFSKPDSGTDGGYSEYTPAPIGKIDKTIGGGITVTME